MENSQFKTVSVPSTGPNSQAVLIAYATDVPMRVLVDNVGVTPLRIATSSGSVASVTADGADHYQLNVTQSRYFVIAPKQRLFVISIGAVGIISVHTSDALPVEKGMVV